MLTFSVSSELAARERVKDLLREAERERLVGLATANREPAAVRLYRVVARIRQALAAAYLNVAVPLPAEGRVEAVESLLNAAGRAGFAVRREKGR